METRLTRPKLEQLWRVLLTTLEGLGTGDAPALARSLAIAALTGRPAEAKGVRVERRGEEVLVIGRPEPVMAPIRPVGQQEEPGRVPSCLRGQALVSP
jgi:hypothetical protein